MMQQNPIAVIEDTLARLELGEKIQPEQIAFLLYFVDQSEYWQRSNASFTEWMRTLIPKLKIKEPRLWRYLTTMRFYQELCRHLAGRGGVKLDPEKWPSKFTADKLEVLYKLFRVVPEDVLTKLVERVIDGSISRDELQETWIVYKPVLEGKTARGRGVSVQRVNASDPTISEAMVLARMYEAFTSNSQSLRKIGMAGEEIPKFFEMFTNVRVVAKQKNKDRIEFDAVAITRQTPGAGITYHGIEVRGMRSQDVPEHHFQLMGHYCDYVWLAIPGSKASLRMSRLPDFVGLLFVENGAVQVMRQAEHCKTSAAHTHALAEELLMRSLNR